MHYIGIARNATHKKVILDTMNIVVVNELIDQARSHARCHMQALAQMCGSMIAVLCVHAINL